MPTLHQQYNLHFRTINLGDLLNLDLQHTFINRYAFEASRTAKAAEHENFIRIKLHRYIHHGLGMSNTRRFRIHKTDCARRTIRIHKTPDNFFFRLAHLSLAL